MNDSGVARIIQGHPPTLCYDLAGQIKPVVEYLEEIGISDVPK